MTFVLPTNLADLRRMRKQFIMLNHRAAKEWQRYLRNPHLYHAMDFEDDFTMLKYTRLALALLKAQRKQLQCQVCRSVSA
jgi:hypothetical protein